MVFLMQSFILLATYTRRLFTEKRIGKITYLVAACVKCSIMTRKNCLHIIYLYKIQQYLNVNKVGNRI
jgi:hypothetical protein